MTHRSFFKFEHTCYFAMASRRTNLCKGFSNPLDTFSSNMDSL